MAELESELESSRHSASSSTAALEGKVKDRDRRVEGLQVRGAAGRGGRGLLLWWPPGWQHASDLLHLAPGSGP